MMRVLLSLTRAGLPGPALAGAQRMAREPQPGRTRRRGAADLLPLLNWVETVVATRR